MSQRHGKRNQPKWGIPQTRIEMYNVLHHLIGKAVTRKNDRSYFGVVSGFQVEEVGRNQLKTEVVLRYGDLEHEVEYVDLVRLRKGYDLTNA